MAPVRPETLAAAVRYAARHGCSDQLFDPRSGRLRPTGEVVSALLDLVDPVLDETDRRQVVPCWGGPSAAAAGGRACCAWSSTGPPAADRFARGVRSHW
ncbi:hypothetical protein GCM10018781_66020 [Kitasatospora indigofera]|uniref:Uncharacterized protein n=1 Tax=Kitasatospora indigofera TaxID=67307 RepID=A0A919GCK8_9ACTN|nr:hypothetical protein GCM10018781_66020 [Kitasatospora indigofera]